MQRRFSGFLALAALSAIASVASIPAAVSRQMEAAGRGDSSPRSSASARRKGNRCTDWSRAAGQREALRRFRRAQGGPGLERNGAAGWAPRGAWPTGSF